MKATQIEFKLRLLIITTIICLGFWAPWHQLFGFTEPHSLMVWLAYQLYHYTALPFVTSTTLAILIATLTAFKGTWFRIWGTAYLGSETVNSTQMQSSTLLADGPYRYCRNPLYWGTWCTILAVAFLMSPSGALCTIVLISIFQLRLHLRRRSLPLHKTRRALQKLPRRSSTPLAAYLPSAQTLQASSSHTSLGARHPRRALPRRHPHHLRRTQLAIRSHASMVRAVIVSFGVSLITRALLPKK